MKGTKGFGWLVLGIIVGAIACSHRIVVLHDPLPAEAHHELALHYMEEGAWKAAERALRRAIRKRPDWPIPYMNLGYLYARQRLWGKAFRAYAKAVRLDGRCADCLNNLAWISLQQGRRLSRALAWVQRAIQIGGPQRYRYFHTAALVALRLGRCDEARRYIEAAFVEAPLSITPAYWEDYRRVTKACDAVTAPGHEYLRPAPPGYAPLPE